MCCCTGITSCSGGNCGYCSECVGAAACNPELCGSCLTGTCQPQTENLTPGSSVGICGNPCITPCLIPNSTIPNCATTQIGPTACCKPCSPDCSGCTDQPPCASKSHQCAKGGGGGSGAGSAGSAGGGKSGAGNASACTSKLSQAMNKLGATMASLLRGGQRTSVAATIPGQAVPKQPLTVSSNTFLLILVIGGAFLLFFAFGHKPVGD